MRLEIDCRPAERHYAFTMRTIFAGLLLAGLLRADESTERPIRTVTLPDGTVLRIPNKPFSMESEKPEPPAKPIKIPNFTPYVSPPNPEPKVFLDGTPIPQLELRAEPKPQPKPAPPPPPPQVLWHIEAYGIIQSHVRQRYSEGVDRNSIYHECNDWLVQLWREEKITTEHYDGLELYVKVAIYNRFKKPGPPPPSDADRIVDAIEKQNKRLKAIEQAFRDAEWQRSMEEHRRAMYRRTSWNR